MTERREVTAKASEGAVRAPSHTVWNEWAGSGPVFTKNGPCTFREARIATEFADHFASAERDRALEEAAAKVQEYFDRWKSCDCQPDFGVSKYNTLSGHAIGCEMDDLFELLAAIRSLKGGK